MGEVHDGWSPEQGYAAWSDAQLVDAVGAADRGALHELFVRHEPWLAVRLSRRCSDPALVDTAVGRSRPELPLGEQLLLLRERHLGRDDLARAHVALLQAFFEEGGEGFAAAGGGGLGL